MDDDTVVVVLVDDDAVVVVEVVRGKDVERLNLAGRSKSMTLRR